MIAYMDAVTIRADRRVRDRLARLAARHGHSLGQELAELVEAAEEDAWWREAEAAWDRPRAEPAAWADYLAEAEELAGDPSALEDDPGLAEFPEYAPAARQHRERRQ